MPIAVDREKLRQVAEEFGLAFVVLFGSLAKGREREDSDADVAVLAERLPEDEGELAEWTTALCEALSEAIPHGEGLDLVLLNRAESLLQFQVALHGILLYERIAGAWPKFKSYAARRYDDDAEFRRRLKEYFERRYGR